MRSYNRRFGGPGIRRGIRGGRGGGESTPLTIAGEDVTAWWHADTYTEGTLGAPDVALLSNIADPGNGDLAQAVSATQPHRTVGPPATIDFDDTVPQYLEYSGAKVFAPSGGNFVAYYTVDLTSFGYLAGYNTTGGVYIEWRTPDGLRLVVNTNAGAITLDTTGWPSGVQLARFAYDASSGVATISRGGSVVATSSALGTGLGASLTTASLGSREFPAWTSAPASAAVRSVVVLDAIPSAAVDTALTDWLMADAGI